MRAAGCSVRPVGTRLLTSNSAQARNEHAPRSEITDARHATVRSVCRVRVLCMSTPSHISLDPQGAWIRPVRPRPSAFILGALLVLISGSCILIPFFIPASKFLVSVPKNQIHLNIHVPLSTVAAAGGAAIGLIGLVFLIAGNARRLRLIYDLTASARELNALMARRSESDEQVYLRAGLDELRDYEDALLRLGAYEQASLVSGMIVENGGRFPYRGGRRSRWV
jgi:hypothetical protein